MERPEPPAAINDVIVQIHASGFVPTEMAWPSTWTDRRDRDRTPSIPGHELAGVVTALGYGTTGLSVGQRVFGLADWHRDGTLAEYVAIEARNLAPLPGDVDFTVGASLPISGLTAWQGLFQHGHLQAGQSVLAHGAAGAVGSMVTQLAREAGAHVIGTGRAADRQKALDFGAQEFVDLDNDALEDVGGIDLVFDVIGGDIGKRSAGLIRAGGTLVSIVGPTEARPDDGLAVDFVVESDRAQLSEIVQRVRDGRLRTNIGNVSTLDDAVAAFNPTERTQREDDHPRSSVSDTRLSMHAAGRRCPDRPAASVEREGRCGLARISHSVWVHRGFESAIVVLRERLALIRQGSPMPTECSAKPSIFAPVEGRPVVAEFDGGAMTSDAGGLLLGDADQGSVWFAAWPGASVMRETRFIEHTVATLVGQRVFGIALGYEDLNDHDDLRHDPVMSVLAGKLEAWRADCAPLAGKSTLNRLELSRESHPYKKIATTPPDRRLVRRPLHRGARRAPKRSPSTSTPPTTRCTAIRRAGFSTATTTATAICRCTCSAAGICWRPSSGPPTSTPAPGRTRRWRGSSSKFGRAGRGCGSCCAAIPASAAKS